MRVHIDEAQLKEGFTIARDDPAFAESAAIVAAGGRPMELLQALALRPEILKAFGGFSECVYPGGLLERSIKELVIIQSSKLNDCQFCRDSHVAVARMLRISDDPLRLLDAPEEMSERESLAIEYTRAVMSDSLRVPDELFDRLRRHFIESEIVELTFLVGYINLLNLFNNALRVTYHGEMDDMAPVAE